MHDVALVNVDALDAGFVKCVTLIAATTEAAHRILASAVLAHVGEGETLVDVHIVNESTSFRAEFVVSFGSGSGALRTSIAPTFTNGATASLFGVKSSGNESRADPESVIEKTLFNAVVDAFVVRCE